VLSVVSVLTLLCCADFETHCRMAEAKRLEESGNSSGAEAVVRGVLHVYEETLPPSGTHYSHTRSCMLTEGTELNTFSLHADVHSDLQPVGMPCLLPAQRQSP
jgi:hypothetical protein